MSASQPESGPLLQPVNNIPRPHRAAHVVALCVIAAKLLERGQFMIVLDTFGDDNHSQSMAQLDCGVHNRGTLRIVVHA